MIYYDLKQEAKRQSLSDVVARENEIKRIARTLKRQYNNNILVRGASGVGKSATVEAFAYRVTKGAIPGFENYKIAKLDSSNLKKLFFQIHNQEIFNYLSSAFKKLPNNSIIFIDDFENICPENRLYEISQALDPFFKRNDLCLVLAMSESGYQRMAKELPNFFQHFEDINFAENDSTETKEIINALKPAFEKEYGIKIEAETIKDIIELSAKMPTDKKSPLRAIHLLDESLAYAKISRLQNLSKKEVREIYAEKTGIPSATLSGNDKDLLKNLETDLNKRVIGQKKASKIIADIVCRSRIGLRNPNRPYGSFLFLGPSGVGKTELSKILAKNVYGSERAFTRIDMSEFTEAHTVQRLIGAPPGYIGYEAGGQLTNAIKQQPYSLILLDEIEKANPKIFDIFLQVFDDGRLTDGKGQTVNFTNSIIIATSNLGISQIVEAYAQGEDIGSPLFLEKKLMPILTANFRIEFLNRFDAIIVFNPLSLEDLTGIAELEIKKIEERVAEHNIKFNIDPQILRSKISGLIDYRFGARPVKRFIEQTCESLIAMKLMNESSERQNHEQ